MSEKESASLRQHVYQISSKADNVDFFSLTLPKNELWGRNFKKSKFGFGISLSKKACMLIFFQNRQL